MAVQGLRPGRRPRGAVADPVPIRVPGRSYSARPVPSTGHAASRTRRQVIAAAASGLWLTRLQAQELAPRPLRLVVPFTPGGSTDILARAIAGEMARDLGQPVVIDNVPGAGGSIGAERVARAPPDGLTLLMGHIGTLAVNPAIYPQLGYDPVRSFAAVAWVARVPNVLAVPADLPVRDLKALVALARSKPGALNYGSGGNGSAAHLAMEYLKLQARFPMVHIPYRGTVPAVTDLVAGVLQAVFTGVPALLPHLRSGRLRALAVSSPSRIALLPEVPSIAESGVPGTAGFEADQWYGVVAPAGTPAGIVRQLNQSINKALASPEVRTRLASEGAEPMATTAEAFARLIAAEVRRWAEPVRRARIQPD